MYPNETSPVLGNPVHFLSQKHIEELAKSGITPDVARECGLRSVSDQLEISEKLNWHKPGNLGECLEFPFFDLDGKSMDFWRFKPGCPRTSGGKYESPSSKGPRTLTMTTRLYFPPVGRDAIRDKSLPLLIVEGEKKAISAAMLGFAVVGICGVDCWSQPRPKDAYGDRIGERRLHDDWEDLLTDRQVYIIFDSDIIEKHLVLKAESNLVEALAQAGATTRTCRFPTTTGKKLGLDDYIVAAGENGKVAVNNLLASAIEPSALGISTTVVRRASCASDVTNDQLAAYPLDALPEVVRTLAVEHGPAVGFDPAAVAVPALVAAGAVLGHAVKAKFKRGMEYGPMIWACMVADGAERASNPIRMMLDSIDETEGQEFKRDYANWKSSGEQGSAPRRKRLVWTNATVEGIGQTQTEWARGLIGWQMRLSAWTQSFAKYTKNFHNSYLPEWRQLGQPGRTVSLRKLDGGNDVPDGHLALFGHANREEVKIFLSANDVMHTGMAAEFLWAMPPERRLALGDSELSKEAESAFIQVLRKLRQVEFKDKPQTVTFSPEAREKLHEWLGTLEDRRVSSTPELRRSLGLADTHVIRLATIIEAITLAGVTLSGDSNTDFDLHIEPISLREISEASISAAISIVEWHLTQAERIYNLLKDLPGNGRLSDDLAALQERWGNEINLRDFMRSNSRKFKTLEDAKRALNPLVVAELCRWEERVNKNGSASTLLIVITDTIRRTTHDSSSEADEPSMSNHHKSPRSAATSNSSDSKSQDVQSPREDGMRRADTLSKPVKAPKKVPKPKGGSQ